ncbi:MAG: extensin family protein [Rhodobacteraceae bacterium]|nr:extensin family protein [Paracoccaceae bacterium]
MAGFRFQVMALVLCAPALAWADAPETSPRPLPRPATTATDAAVATAMTAPQRPDGAMRLSEAAALEAARARQEAEAARHAAEAVQAARIDAARVVAERVAHDEDEEAAISPMAVPASPFPRHRTDSVVQRFATLAAIRAQTRSETQATPAAQPAERSGGPSGRGLCGVRGLGGRELPRITSSTQGCGVERPVSVTSVGGIPLSLAATLDCDTATAFERWVRTEALPAVGRTGGGVAQIRVIGHYSCRTRNSQPGARISEHGRGRAIDIAGFRLVNGDVVTVEQHYRRGRYSRMLHQMYQAACGIFRTTLSPDSDRFHQDHFHFDLAQHRGGGTYCR